MKPSNACFWDRDVNQIINLFEMITSVATGMDLVTGNEGVITL